MQTISINFIDKLCMSAWDYNPQWGWLGGTQYDTLGQALARLSDLG